jgi:ferredoxin
MPKLIHYRDKCIGCGVCYEQQSELWRRSKRDGKASLIKGIKKNEVYVLEIPSSALDKSREIALACPVRIIKVS